MANEGRQEDWFLEQAKEIREFVRGYQEGYEG